MLGGFSMLGLSVARVESLRQITRFAARELLGIVHRPLRLAFELPSLLGDLLSGFLPRSRRVQERGTRTDGGADGHRGQRPHPFF